MKNYVWYACYGSNINEDRFTYYIKGGKYPVNGGIYFGCRDKTNFISKTTRSINHRLYFAEKSGSWEDKAVAFITSNSSDKYETKCVLYKVTIEQFIDVFLQENGEDPETSVIVTPEEIKDIKPGSQKNIGKDNEIEWYGRLLRLENHSDGCRVYTFTSKNADEAIKAKEPGEKYLNVIGEGLLKNFDLNKNDVAAYMYNLQGVRDSSWDKDKIALLFPEKFRVIPTGKRNAPKGQFIAQLTKKDLDKNRLSAGRSEVIISHNIKDTKHIFKTAVRIQQYPDDNGLDQGTIALDQTIRDAIGCTTQNSNLDEEYYTVSLLPKTGYFNFIRKLTFYFLKSNIFNFDRQFNIVRVFKATPNDMEINICRLGVSTMQSIGIEDGDKIIVKSTTNKICIRALTMNQKDANEYKKSKYLETDKKYKRFIDFITEKVNVAKILRSKTETAKKAKKPKIEDLAMIFIDLDARQELGIELGDPVTIYRSNKFAIQKNIQVITIPLLLAFLGIGLKLKEIVPWVDEHNNFRATIIFYFFCSAILIWINLQPIRKKFK